MANARLATVILACVVVAAYFVWWFSAHGLGSNKLTSTTDTRQADVLGNRSAGDSPKTLSLRPLESSVDNSEQLTLRQYSMQRVFETENDLRAFVDTRIESASAGDPESQYYLFKALVECQLFAWASIGDGRTSKDDWMLAKNNLSVERKDEVSRSYDRCQEFVGAGANTLAAYYGDDHHSNMQEWLQMAADSGHPIAQSMVAAEFIRSTDKQEQDEGVLMLQKAAFSRDPEAIKYIADYFVGEDNDEFAAWTLVACDFGHECGPDSDLTKRLCYLPRSCARGESAADVLRANIGNYNFEQAENRASEIIAAVNRNDANNLKLHRLKEIFK